MCLKFVKNKVVIEWWDVTSVCIHDVSCSVYFCGINVTRMWHLTPHNERLVFRDKFALRHRNTIRECPTWWKEQETERTINLLPIITFSENLLHKILAGLSCIVESACSKTWLLIWVCLYIFYILCRTPPPNIQRQGRQWKPHMETGSGGLCFTFPCLVVGHMSIIRLRLPSIPSCSLSHWAPYSTYYQLYCHQPSDSFLFFPLTEKQRSWKGHCCQQCVALSSWLNRCLTNMAKRFYPQRVLARSLHFTRPQSRMHINYPSIHRNGKNELQFSHFCLPYNAYRFKRSTSSIKKKNNV